MNALDIAYLVVVVALTILAWRREKVLKAANKLIQSQNEIIGEYPVEMDKARKLYEDMKERALLAETQAQIARHVLEEHGFKMTFARFEGTKQPDKEKN